MDNQATESIISLTQMELRGREILRSMGKIPKLSSSLLTVALVAETVTMRLSVSLDLNHHCYLLWKTFSFQKISDFLGMTQSSQ